MRRALLTSPNLAHNGAHRASTGNSRSRLRPRLECDPAKIVAPPHDWVGASMVVRQARSPAGGRLADAFTMGPHGAGASIGGARARLGKPVEIGARLSVG